MTADRTAPRSLPYTTSDDDWLDAALAAEARDHGSSYLDDQGLTPRVMAALPAPVTVPPVGRGLIVIVYGGPSTGPVVNVALHDLTPSTCTVVLAAVPEQLPPQPVKL